jgi:hypothetical protein
MISCFFLALFIPKEVMLAHRLDPEELTHHRMLLSVSPDLFVTSPIAFLDTSKRNFCAAFCIRVSSLSLTKNSQSFPFICFI